MNEQNKIERINPKELPAPVGHYSHITKVPKGMDLYITSGQVGVDAKGQIPTEFNQQVTQTFANIKGLLATQGLTSDAIIKINIWATETIDWDYFYEQWGLLFTADYPSMTVAYISALGLPELKLEIEVWAAK